MTIKELEKRVIELDEQMQEIVNEVGYDLKNVKSVKKKDLSYRRIKCVVDQYHFIHYILFSEDFLKDEIY